MSIVGSLVHAVRSSPIPQQAWNGTGFGGFRMMGGTTAGARVSHETAMTLDAVYACVRLISDTISTLPVDLKQQYPQGAYDRPKPRWMIRANAEATWREFIQQIMTSLLLDGNAFIAPGRSGTGEVTELWTLDPREVSVLRDTFNGALCYQILGKSYTAADIIHIKGLTLPGYLRGLSPVEMARTTLGTNMAAEQSAGKLFENGLLSQVVITSDKPVSDAIAREMSNRLAETHTGAPNFWKPVVFGGGATVAPLNLTPEQSQFLESRAYGVQSVARWFGVPLIRIQQTTDVTSWGSGIEQINIMYTQDAITPKVVALEEVFTPLVRAFDPTYFVKWNLKGLLRGDSASRSAYLKAMVEMGAYSPNFALRQEDENPFTGGDAHYFPLNYGRLGPDGELLQPAAAAAGGA